MDHAKRGNAVQDTRPVSMIETSSSGGGCGDVARKVRRWTMQPRAGRYPWWDSLTRSPLVRIGRRAPLLLVDDTSHPFFRPSRCIHGFAHLTNSVHPSHAVGVRIRGLFHVIHRNVSRFLLHLSSTTLPFVPVLHAWRVGSSSHAVSDPCTPVVVHPLRVRLGFFSPRVPPMPSGQPFLLPRHVRGRSRATWTWPSEDGAVGSFPLSFPCHLRSSHGWGIGFDPTEEKEDLSLPRNDVQPIPFEGRIEGKAVAHPGVRNETRGVPRCGPGSAEQPSRHAHVVKRHGKRMLHAELENQVEDRAFG